MARRTSSSLTKSTVLLLFAEWVVLPELAADDAREESALADRPPFPDGRVSSCRRLSPGPAYMLPASISSSLAAPDGCCRVCLASLAGCSGVRPARNLSTIAAISSRLILPAFEPDTA